MTVNVYSSSDSGAIAANLYFTSRPGSLLTILDACLVNGYSGKASAGWTKPYAGTNITAYQMPSGNQRYLRIDDTNSQYAIVTGYEAMSGINTGTGAFPEVVRYGQAQTYVPKTNISNVAGPTPIVTVVPASKQFKFTNDVRTQLGTMQVGDRFVVTGNSDPATNGIYTVSVIAAFATGITTITVAETIPGTATNDGTVLPGYRPSWYVVATDKSVYGWINFDGTPNNNTSNSQMFFFGDIVSYRPSDTFNTVLMAQTITSPTNICNLSVVDSVTGGFMARRFTQLSGSVPCMTTCHSGAKFSTVSGVSNVAGVPFPNPIDGGIVLSPLWVSEGTVTSPYTIRGVLPGLWWLGHSAPLTTGDIVSGTDGSALAGKLFLVLSTYNTGTAYGQMLLEISNTW